MPDEETEESKPETGTGKLKKDWQKLAGWQKAGVLIGGGALVVAILMYINSQRGPTLTGNSAVPAMLPSPNFAPTNFPGEGDQFPPVPVPPVPTQPVNGPPNPPIFRPFHSPFGTATTVTNAGALASTPGGTNNSGRNLANLTPGATLYLLSGGPKTFKGTNYYQVQYNGQTGYVRGSTIGKS